MSVDEDEGACRFLNANRGCFAMNTKILVALMVYAALLIAASAVPLWAERAMASRAILFGCVSGALCLIWGFLGFLGFRRRIGAGLTLGVIGFVLLSQTVTRWLPSSGGKPESFLLTVLITIMLVVTLGLLGWMIPREDFEPPDAAGAQKKPKETDGLPQGGSHSDPKTTNRAASSARR